MKRTYKASYFIHKTFINLFLFFLILIPSYGYSKFSCKKKIPDSSILKDNCSFYKFFGGCPSLKGLKILLKHKSPNTPCEDDGWTALHAAINYGIKTNDFSYAQFLMTNGSDYSIPNNANIVPLDMKGIPGDELANLKKLTIYPSICDINVQQPINEIENIEYFSAQSPESDGIIAEGTISREDAIKIMNEWANQITYLQTPLRRINISKVKTYNIARNHCLQEGFQECGSPINLSNIKQDNYIDHPMLSDCIIKNRERGAYGDPWNPHITLSFITTCRIEGIKYKTLSATDTHNIRCEKINHCITNHPSNQNFQKMYSHYRCNDRNIYEKFVDLLHDYVF